MNLQTCLGNQRALTAEFISTSMQILGATLVWVPLIINETVINENVILKYLLIILIFI